MFSHLSPWKHHKCVLKPSEQGSFFPRRSISGVTCLGLVKKWMFSHLSPWKHHKCVLKPQNRAHFSKMIDLRGHMPRFTIKKNVFPSICLESVKMAIGTLRRGPVSPRWSIWGVTCQVSSKNECFPIYLHENPINVCWNPQNSARFSKTIDLRGHMPRFTIKMNVFPSISLETP